MAEIQLLSALMLRNTTENKFVNVFLPSITKRMQHAYALYDHLKHDHRTDDMETKLKNNLHSFCDYIKCVCDLFEHKFLVFLCNCTETHWFTFIMVNLSVVYSRGHPSKKWKGNTNLLDGWSVFNSMGWSKGKQPNAKESSLIMTTESAFNAFCGTRFFLNFCATYLYSKDDAQNKKKPLLTLHL